MLAHIIFFQLENGSSFNIVTYREGRGDAVYLFSGVLPIKDGKPSQVNFQNPKSIEALKKSTTQSGNMMFLVTMA